MLSKHWFTFLSVVFLPNPGRTSPSIIWATCPNWKILTIRKCHIEVSLLSCILLESQKKFKTKDCRKAVCVCARTCVRLRAHARVCTYTPAHVFKHLSLAPFAFATFAVWTSLGSLLLTSYNLTPHTSTRCQCCATFRLSVWGGKLVSVT